MSFGGFFQDLITSRLFWGLLALALWVGSYYVYLRGDISRYFKKRSPQRWGVDLESRRITSGRKPLV